MQLNTLVSLLAILICPASMGIMMWKMNRSMDDHRMQMRSDGPARPDDQSISDEVIVQV